MDIISYLDILSDPVVAGPHRRVQSLAMAMRAAGHQPLILLPRGASKDSAFCQELYGSEIPFVINPKLMQVRAPRLDALPHNLRWLFQTARLFTGALVSREAFAETRAFVVNGILNTFLCAHPQLARLPGIVIINDTIVPRRAFTALYKFWHKRVSMVFQTPSVKEFYLGGTGYSFSDDDIMAPGVDLNVFSAAGRSRPFRKAEGRILLGSLSNLSPRKGIEDGIRIASAVAEAVPQMRVEYQIAGDLLKTQDEYLRLLQQKTQQLPENCSVEFLGFLDPRESVRFLKTLDALVLPSRSESFPQVVVQAQAVGTPVFAYRIPGVVDQIEDGRTGYLEELFDTVALARRVLEAIAAPDQVAEVCDRAIERVHTRWSLDQNREKFVRIIERAVRSSGR